MMYDFSDPAKVPEVMPKKAYENYIATTHERRIAWWREARFGMFIHYGAFSVAGRHEWVMAMENFGNEEYEDFARRLNTKPGACREWAATAKAAGMKYMVLTTRHMEGFHLWDSKVNSFNSMNYGPKRDIVREFVDACREFGLGVGLYFSLIDLRHPDSARACYDIDANVRITRYTQSVLEELMTNYGKIDILWYDALWPLTTYTSWDSIRMNLMVRRHQPDILINNRACLEDDFGTPEDKIVAIDRDFEACMTFNHLSWGYLDSKQAAPFGYSAQQILRMLNQVSGDGGNLLLNIGPAPDGSVPEEAKEPLETVGRWLKVYGEAVYGNVTRTKGFTNGIGHVSIKGNKCYYFNFIWPNEERLILASFATKLLSARFLATGTPIEFEQSGQRIILKHLPEAERDTIANVSVIELEFVKSPTLYRCSHSPQMTEGYDSSDVFEEE